MVSKIMVPIDGSENSLRALDFAINMAKNYKAKIYIIHIVVYHPVPSVEGGINPEKDMNRIYNEERLNQICRNVTVEAEDKLRQQGISNFEVICKLSQDAAEEVLNTSEEKGVDIVIMGKRGMSKLQKLFMGSVSDKVCQLSSRTCLIT